MGTIRPLFNSVSNSPSKFVEYACHNCHEVTVHLRSGGITCLICGTDHVEKWEKQSSITESLIRTGVILGATQTTAVHLESLITKDFANGMTKCAAHLDSNDAKEKDCKWYQESSTAKRCMYWRESCECCDKVVIDDKGIN